MAPSDAGLWFDASALRGAKDRSIAGALRSLRPRGRFTDREHAALAAFAAANGLTYARAVDNRERDLPSSVLTETSESVVASPGAPSVEVGNHGWRFLPSDLDEAPERRGYVAIEHGLDLPQIRTENARLSRRPSIGAVADTVLEVMSIFDPDAPTDNIDHGAPRGRPFGRIEVPAGCDLLAYAFEDCRAEATRLISGALDQLVELDQRFEIEIRDGWFFAYSLDGELSTLDPDRWAWAFYVASRMLDILAGWEPGFAGDRAGLSFYTPSRWSTKVERTRGRRTR